MLFFSLCFSLLQFSSSSTENSTCQSQCPSGYLIGSTSCFMLYPSSKATSYQASLALCMATDRQTLASQDMLRDRTDIQLIQSQAAEQSMNWFFTNGIGSRKERMEKRADVYSVFDQSLISSPIAATVKVSEKFSNISTLCVIPQYCDPPTCNIENLFLTFDYFAFFKTSANSLKVRETATLTCIFSKKEFNVTCGSLGNIYPEPSLLECQRSTTSEIIKDTTNETVSSCSRCFTRGTDQCIEVDGGYQCVCKKPFFMSRCQITTDLCTSDYCGENGVCKNEVGSFSCECNIGYSGDRCETNLREKYKKSVGYSTFAGLILAIGAFLMRLVKRGVALARLDTNADDDPQTTHQILRTYCIFVGGAIVFCFSNPALFNINQSACRFNFIAIHFSFIMGMVQWVLEAWNVNQVFRCVHLNEWENAWDGHKTLGARIAPRMILAFLAVACGLLVTFQAGWNQLAAPWTCVGVICQSTVSIWIPIFAMVVLILIYAGAIYESSVLINSRRPLLGFRMELRIERELGYKEGRRIEKCLRNRNFCIIGLLLLDFIWFLIILSADYKDSVTIGLITLASALIYSIFAFYHEVETCPEDRAMWVELMQRYLPLRLAPSYNAENMWTVDEVKSLYSLPAVERKARYKDYMTRNQFLHLHHRWDLRFNELLAENKLTINDALVRVFCEEMSRLKENNGSIHQKHYIQHAYKDFLSSIPDYDPRTEKGRVKAQLELVTLAAEAPIGVKLAKFFIVPGFDVFRAEDPDEIDKDLDQNERQHKRMLGERIQMNYYRVMREEAHAQAVFINSNILFHYFGNEVVR